MGFLDFLTQKKADDAKLGLPQTRGMSLVLIPKTSANQAWITDTKFKPLALEGYSRSSVVYACIENLATSVPEPPVKFYVSGLDAEDEEIQIDPRLINLIKYPNELMSEYDMFRLATVHLSISGITYWWKERSNDGTVIALWPLRPDRVGPLYSTSTAKGQRVLSHWVYHNPGTNEPIFLPRSDVWFTNYPDPLGPSGGMVEGLGPLIALAREVASDNEATRFVATLLGNYAQPGWAVQLKSTVQSEDEARMLKMKFQSQFGGAHLGEAAIIDADTTLTKLSFDLQELEFPSLREFSETRIAAAFRTPAILVGLNAGLQRSTYSNAQEARKDFTERSLESIWRLFEDSMNRDLVPDFNVKAQAKFDRSKIKALADTRLALTVPIEQGYNAGVVKRNEYRKALSLPPDLTPDGDKYKDTTPASPFGAFGSPFGGQGAPGQAPFGGKPSPFGQNPAMGKDPMSNAQDPKQLPPGMPPGQDPTNNGQDMPPEAKKPSWVRGSDNPADQPPRQPSWARPKERKPSFLAKALKAGIEEIDPTSLTPESLRRLSEQGLPDSVVEVIERARMAYGSAADALAPQLQLFLEEQASRVAAKLTPNLSWDYLSELFPEVEDDFLAQVLLPFLEDFFGVTVSATGSVIGTATQAAAEEEETKEEAKPEPKAEGPETRYQSVTIGDPRDKDKVLSEQALAVAKKIIIGDLLDRVKGISEITRASVAKIIQDGVDQGKSLPQIASDIKGSTTFSPNRAMLIARTETALLYNKTAVATYASTGMVKLVRVHDGIEDDEACRTANGQIWSLEYALQHPIEHPNCRRALSPVFDESMMSSKSLKLNPYSDTLLDVPQAEKVTSDNDAITNLQTLGRLPKKADFLSMPHTDYIMARGFIADPSDNQLKLNNVARKAVGNKVMDDDIGPTLLARRLKDNDDFVRFAKIAIPPLPYDPIDGPKDVVERACFAIERSWSLYHYGKNILTSALQHAVARAIGVAVPVEKNEDLASKVQAFDEAFGPATDAYVQAQYDETQSQLAAAGIKRVTLARGLSFGTYRAMDNPISRLGGVAVRRYVSDTSGPPLSSWTENRSVAIAFARGLISHTPGALAVAKVPAKDIQATFYSGLGSGTEVEYVVRSGKVPALVDTWAMDEGPLFDDYSALFEGLN